jgi:hypothetical protein
MSIPGTKLAGASRSLVTRAGPAIAWLAVAVGVSGVVFHGWYAVASEHYLQFTGGVWLALARDLSDGTLYRGVISEVGYGGTRYFPLYFSLIAALIKLGVPPLAAAHAVSLASTALLFAAVTLLVRRLGLPGRAALFLAVFAIAPNYLEQTVFAIRCDILAAALVIWGLIFTLPRAGTAPTGPGTSMPLAAFFFTLALATKPTAVYGTAVAMTVMALHGRWRTLLRLTAWSAAGALVFFAVLQALSGGRALESFRACALAGGTGTDLVRSLFAVRLGPIGGLRFLTVVLGCATLALLFDLHRSWRDLPSVLFLFAAATTAVILGSPGTVHPNQVTDVHVAAVVGIAAFVRRRDRFRTAAYGVLVCFLLFAGYQDYSRVLRQRMPETAKRWAAERQGLVDAVEGFSKPVLSESPEYPVLAGKPAYLLDAFTLRVIVAGRPDVLADVLTKLNARTFAYLLLDEDPETPGGRGWYENVHFGWTVMQAMLANYRYKESHNGMRIYVPKPVVTGAATGP